MKKSIGILLIFIQFACGSPRKDELILKIKYQPAKKYILSTIRGTETVLTYSGEEIAMKEIQRKRIPNPTISKIKTKSDAELQTGALASGTNIPVSLKYLKTLSLDGENEIPSGTILTGSIAGNNQPTFNSVNSEQLDNSQKLNLLETVRNAFEQLNFPEKSLKIGDQFTTNRNTSIPMQLSVIEMVVTTTYKLVSIKNDQAEFDLIQNYLMTPQRMDNTFTGTGSGKGYIYYNIKDCLISDYSVKTELVMNKRLDYFGFELVAKNEFSQTTRMEKQ